MSSVVTLELMWKRLPNGYQSGYQNIGDKTMAKTDLTTDTQIKKVIKDTIKADKTISYPIAIL